MRRKGGTISSGVREAAVGGVKEQGLGEDDNESGENGEVPDEKGTKVEEHGRRHGRATES